MIEPINRTNINEIENPDFRTYANVYVNIEQDFLQQISSYGLGVSTKDYEDIQSPLAQSLLDQGIMFSNDCKSLHRGWISPSCITCRKGIRTATFLISVQCPKSCYYCFNVNQVDYEHLLTHTKDVAAELKEYSRQGIPFEDLALTGGEPLIHKEETLAFFSATHELYPQAYTRLYTSGVGLTESYLQRFSDVHLNEIRFSIKTDEAKEDQRKTLERIELSKQYIPHVVVEMPILPDCLELMRELLIKLDKIGIDGINLLEFCFPLSNAKEFVRRGYAIKKTPLRVLYDYWYAGGVPIAGSEQVCLNLLEFALEEDLDMGVHYCTLENKLSGQIFSQNKLYSNDYPSCIMSERDYFLKAAKVFGEDARLFKALLDEKGLTGYREDVQDNYLEFNPGYLDFFKDYFGDIEVGISYYVVERCEESCALRELRIDKTTPASFNASCDI